MGTIDTPSGLRPYMGEDEIRRTVANWSTNQFVNYIIRHHRGDPITIQNIAKLSYDELKLRVMASVQGVEPKTTEDLSKKPRHVLEHIILQGEAQRSRLRVTDVDLRPETEAGREVELNTGRRIGIAKMLFELQKTGRLPETLGDKASEDMKQLLAHLNIHYIQVAAAEAELKTTLGENEKLKKSDEQAKKNYDAKVEEIKTNGERFLKAENDKFVTDKAEIEKNFNVQKEKLAGELKAYETTLAEALLNTLDPKDENLEAKTAAIKKAGFIDCLLRVEELGKDFKDKKEVYDELVKTYLGERTAHLKTKAASQRKSEEAEKRQAEDAKRLRVLRKALSNNNDAIENLAGELRGYQLKIAEALIKALESEETPVEPERIEEIRKAAFLENLSDLEATDVRLHATLTETRTELIREQELTGDQQRSIEELAKANRSQVGFVAYAQAQIDAVEKFAANAVIANSREFRKAALKRAVFLGIPIAALSFIVGNVYIALGYLQRSYEKTAREINRPAYIQGSEGVVETPGGVKIVPLEIIVREPALVEIPDYGPSIDLTKPEISPEVPTGIQEFKKGEFYVSYGRQSYSMSVPVFADITKKISEQKSKLGRELTSAERKACYDADPRVKKQDSK